MHRKETLRLVLLIAPILLAESSFGRVISVRKDGTGDFLTLTAAVADAGAGDSIAVGPGSYAEGASISLDFPLRIFSTDGQDVTILDGANSHRLFVTSSPGIEFVQLTFANGRGEGSFPTGAGAFLALSRSQVSVENCRFENHLADWGGAIYVTDSSLGNDTRLDVRGSTFDSNMATDTAGAIYVVNGAVASFDECTFSKNETGIKAGAVHVIRSTAQFEDCLFTANRSGDIAGGIFFESSAGSVEACTFFDHTSPGGIAGTIVIQLSAGTNITRNIFAGDTAGYGLRYFQGTDAHSCNVFSNNAAGAVGEDQLAPDEVVADPLFCDPLAGDFTLSDNSPAAPANSLCGQLIGKFPVACSLPAPGVPRIASIEDVPGDDGRQVRLRWERSSYDARQQPFVITGYGVYRRQDANATAPPAVSATEAGENPRLAVDGWDYVATVPARGDPIYQFVAPTFCDTPRNGETCWSAFFVSAMTTDPLTFFDSEPDSGTSSDDLPPSPPGHLLAARTGSGLEIAWDPSPEHDVLHYRIYRGMGDFELSDARLVQTTSQSSWIDPTVADLASTYKVTAVDDAGNESDPAISLGSERRPRRFELHRSEPNPFNPTTTIHYDVPGDGGNISLRIYDVRGKLVRSLIDGFESPGADKSTQWNGANDAGQRLPAGVYFCRLEAEGYEHSLRIVLIQ